MLKAMSDNTIRNQRNIVFVKDNMIVRRYGTTRKRQKDFILRVFPRADQAAHCMADAWCIAASSNSGISLGHLIEILIGE